MRAHTRAKSDPPLPTSSTREGVDDGWGLMGEPLTTGPQDQVPVASSPVLTNWWPVDDGWVLPDEPMVDPEFAAVAGGEVIEAEAPARVNLNTAGVDELCTVQGIGKGKARAIVAHRERNGAFSTVHALAEVRGFGAKTVAKLADQLTV